MQCLLELSSRNINHGHQQRCMIYFVRSNIKQHRHFHVISFYDTRSKHSYTHTGLQSTALADMHIPKRHEQPRKRGIRLNTHTCISCCDLVPIPRITPPLGTSAIGVNLQHSHLQGAASIPPAHVFSTRVCFIRYLHINCTLINSLTSCTNNISPSLNHTPPNTWLSPLHVQPHGAIYHWSFRMHSIWDKDLEFY